MALIQADDKTVPMKHNKIILLANMIANMWSSETLASLRDRRSSLLEHEANETKVKGRQTNSLWQKKIYIYIYIYMTAERNETFD